ncbi:MAG: bifunctional diguanylate cyclase/phosphodiesterase [Pseudomonadota bacterium]
MRQKQGAHLRQTLPVLLSGLLLTGLFWYFMSSRVDQELRSGFEAEAEAGMAEITQLMRIYMEALHGVASLYAASEKVTRAEFRSYVERLNIEKRYPGIKALEFARRVPEEAKADYERRVRQDTSLESAGYPHFAIFPVGHRPEHVVVEYVEPMRGNETALGYDLASETMRRQAVELARDSGEPTASAPIDLVQGTGKGLLFIIPIYRNGAPTLTLEQRREAFLGVVAAVFNTASLMAGALQPATRQKLAFSIFDTGTSRVRPSPAIPIYDSMRSSGIFNHPPATTLRKEAMLDVGGRRWRIDITALPTPGGGQRQALPMFILLGGGVISLLLFGIASSLAARRTALRQADTLAARLRDRDETLRLAAKVFDNSSEGIVFTDVHANIVAVNKAYTKITGYSESEILGQNPRLLQSHWQDPMFYEAMWRELQSKGHWEGEILDRRKDGPLYVQWLTIDASHDEQGQITHYIGICTDTTEHKKAQEHIQRLSYHDPLTGLPNRLLLQDRIGLAIAEAQRNNTTVAVLFLDLDRFKTINDSLGHLVGDKLLQQMAQRLSACLHEAATVSRIGGDEYVIVLPNISETSVVADTAHNLLTAVSAPLAVEGQTFHVSASIGISLYPGDGQDVQTLMKYADTAMYHAKENGRNNFRFFMPQLNLWASERLEMENDLRQALERGEFVLYYQPQVEMVSGHVTGLEALIRWPHPTKGMLSPDRFISIAEETGIIILLGEWVLRSACTQGVIWQQQGLKPLPIGVNLSAAQFHQHGLVENISRILHGTGLPPQLLELEITESMLMRHAEPNIAVLERLSKMGIKIAIDDFGTGYSSLNYLKRFPIDRLKIDKSFVQHITTDPEDAAIVSAIIALAASLEMEVIAEGVETRQQRDFLHDQGCHLYQGHLCAQPMPAENVIAYLQEATLCAKAEG